jgi:hypothetical protein
MSAGGAAGFFVLPFGQLALSGRQNARAPDRCRRHGELRVAAEEEAGPPIAKEEQA